MWTYIVIIAIVLLVGWAWNQHTKDVYCGYGRAMGYVYNCNVVVTYNVYYRILRFEGQDLYGTVCESFVGKYAEDVYKLMIATGMSDKIQVIEGE